MGAAFDWVAVLDITVDLLTIGGALSGVYEKLIKRRKKPVQDSRSLCVAPARSIVRSAPEWSAFPETRGLAHAEVTSGKRRACPACAPKQSEGGS
jgi:hypothetical protein